MTKKPQMIEKEAAVSELGKYMQESSITILADYRGLNVAEVTELRAKLREAGATFKVAKNTLLKRAANELGIADLDQHLEGPTAVAFSQDPVALAKIMVDFIKNHSNLEIKTGLLDRVAVSEEDLNNLAKLPSREVLLGQVLGAMQAPMYGFAGALAGVMRQFVYALDQVREQKAANA